MKAWKLEPQALLFVRLMGCLLLSLVFDVYGTSFLSSAQAEIVDVSNTGFGRAVGEDLTFKIRKQVCKIHICAVSNGITLDANTGNIRTDIHVTFKKLCKKNLCISLPVKTADAYFVYNLQNRNSNGELRLTFARLKAGNISYSPPAFTINLNQMIRLIEDNLKDNLSLEELLELIPNPLPQVYRVERSNEWKAIGDSYQKTYGAQNVYFATFDFVDWANPCEKAGTWGVELLVTGGAAAELIMKQVESKLREQSDKILNWLSNKGEQHAESLLVTLLSGERFTWPYLAAVWQPIKFKATHVLFGRPTKTFACNHAGFVLIWDWGKVKGLDSLLAQKGTEIYTDLTNEIFQQLYRRNPSAAELKSGVAGFTNNGNAYAEQIFADAATKIYQEIYGSGVRPTPDELAEARAAFANGLSYAEVRAKVEAIHLAMLRKERALQFVLNYYMMTRHKQ